MLSWKLSRVIPALVLLALALSAAPQASASPVGLLRTDSGAGGVIVGLTSIDWYPPTGPPNGSFVVAGGTTLTSAAGNPAVGSTGLLLDLSFGSPLPVPGFISFPAVPGLLFDLNSIGPGSANTNCAVLGIGGACSPFLGSPFILTRTATGTAISLSVGGQARDGTLPNSTWLGTFTSQLARLDGITAPTPADIQTFFGCSPGSVGPAGCTNQSAVISSSHSGEFFASVEAVPEPASLLLLGAGLAGLVARRGRPGQR